MVVADKRGKILLQLYALSLAGVLLLLTLQLVLEPAVSTIILGGFAIILAGGLVLVVSGRAIGQLGICYSIALYLTVGGYAAVSGGIHSPAFPWFLFCHLISMLLMSASAARVWLMIAAAAVTILLFADPWPVATANSYRVLWHSVSLGLLFAATDQVISIFRARMLRRNEKLQRANHTLHREHLELMDAQRQIHELNLLLEEKVQERTAELKARNTQLANFAYINAHQIRGPVCRLLGLANLLQKAQTPHDIMQLRDHLTASAEELDAITRAANRVLSSDTHYIARHIDSTMQQRADASGN